MTSVSSEGFKQVPAGSGYLTVMSTINVTNVYAPTFTQSGSGGAFTVAAPTAYPWLTGSNASSNISSALTFGKVIRDMGRTQISSGRVFRKFKAVSGVNNGTTSTGDFAGGDSNFGTFYLETVANGGDVPAANASVLARAF
jgi:hypothetical protein